MERRGITTMKGNPMTLVGPALQPGDEAPDFLVLDQTMAPKTLKDFAGKFKVISVTPSLDTPVCDLQIHWFNEDASKQPQDVAVLNISMDLPFAIRRFCATGGIENAVALSDHRDASFGTNWRPDEDFASRPPLRLKDVIASQIVSEKTAEQYEAAWAL